ncbi:hypothetical protein PF008_g787 [Phytophthora fragariae]|uniref:Protein Lines N-terminal domain-containing protein n=1 Tax=Phytophthora fragariae TaxID=53985 RepID=A0A6G0SMM9_9STRA|nr:hypothetical protein PF008_g787 [Phytophthora fragariae]
MDWRRRIEVCSTAVQGHRDDSGGAIKTLLGLLDDDDVLVAFVAKEALLGVLISDAGARSECVNGVVKELVTTSPECWRREANGFRFQVLRQLLKVESGYESVQDDSDGGEDEQPGRVMENSCLQEILQNIGAVVAMVRSVFAGPHECPTTAAPYSVQYEALAFLSDFVERLCNLEKGEVSRLVELIEQVIVLVGDIFVPMDYSSQPTFLTCEVLEFFGDFQTALECWKDQTLGEESDIVSGAYKKWLECCLDWLMESSCTSTALQLLDSNESSNVSSHEVFIGKSTRYPFLQQWLVLLSRIGVAVLGVVPDGTMSTESQALDQSDKQPAWAKQIQLPNRRQLFAVLAEQDDVMIEVLNGLTRMASLATARGGISKQLDRRFAWASPSIAYLIAAYDPDLLFADLVDTLGRDHLVLLDLLVSNETKMLEYIMRYLRHLGAHWNTCKQKLLANKRLESVMSVLIRLRLEIDKLVAADLFPFGAGSLTRRLVSIEHLYEESGDEGAQRL